MDAEPFAPKLQLDERLSLKAVFISGSGLEI